MHGQNRIKFEVVMLKFLETKVPCTLG